jgi:3-hydroxyisobutyrate dehydrogenase-like beta-hydroxyacid dehydrogenase
MTERPVTVVGTGTMGSALARALLAAGHAVTVWNRTPSRAKPLRDAGATVAGSLPDAVGSGDLTIMCVADQAAARELLAGEPVLEALRGRTLLQLTTGTASDGRRGAELAREREIAYLVGAILAYPRMIGTDGAVFLYAGEQATYEDQSDRLRALGTARYLGQDTGRPAANEAGLIALFYGTLAGFIHGVSLARAEGIELAGYVELAREYLATFVTEAVDDIGQRVLISNYDDAQSSMHTHLGGVENLVVGSSREAGIDHQVMAAIGDWFASAIHAGAGERDIAVLVELAAAGSAPSRGDVEGGVSMMRPG